LAGGKTKLVSDDNSMAAQDDSGTSSICDEDAVSFPFGLDLQFPSDFFPSFGS
jgi:hypothetical protein